MTVETGRAPKNPCFEQKFAPASGEVDVSLDMIQGGIPQGLQGCLLRIDRSYRYCWASRLADSSLQLFDAFVKFDRAQGTEQVYPLGADKFMGEAIFAPRPGGKQEDDGWVDNQWLKQYNP